MGAGCSHGVFCGARPGTRLGASSLQVDNDYEQLAYLDPSRVTPDLVAQLRRHAFLLWVVLPVGAVLQGFAPEPALTPTCERGFSNYPLILLAVVVAHHLWMEHKAWYISKSLCSMPEVSVLRQLGVLRRRRRLVALAVLQDIDLYLNLMFPFIALDCDQSMRMTVTKKWTRAWEVLPHMGRAVSGFIYSVSYYGLSFAVWAVMLLLGLHGLLHVCLLPELPQHRNENTIGADAGDRVDAPFMHGDDFVELAFAADTALTPSVMVLCDEMSEQKRHIYDDAKGGDAARREKGRQDFILGRITKEGLEKLELENAEERARVDRSQKCRLISQFVGKLLTSVVAQLFLQTTFFELAYDILGDEAKIKVVAGILLSSFLIFVNSIRCCYVVSKLGCTGVFFFALSALVVLWAAAKVFFGIRCREHVWNISTGCVPGTFETALVNNTTLLVGDAIGLTRRSGVDF